MVLIFVFLIFLVFFLLLFRRPIPVGAEDIGTWLSILQLTAVISVVTNSGILCFTMDLLTFTGVGKLWIFIGFQYAIFIAMAIFAYLVDDVPYEVGQFVCFVCFLFLKHVF